MPRKRYDSTPHSRLIRFQSERDGWYHNGTWAKAKIIMKAKITAILDGVPPNDAAFVKVAEEMPEIMRSSITQVIKTGRGGTTAMTMS